MVPLSTQYTALSAAAAPGMSELALLASVVPVSQVGLIFTAMALALQTVVYCHLLVNFYFLVLDIDERTEQNNISCGLAGIFLSLALSLPFSHFSQGPLKTP